MALRDLLIAGILAVGLLATFRHAFIGVLLWTWVSIMNPHKLAYGFTHDAPIAAVVAGVTLIALMTTRDRVKPVFPPPLVFLILFLSWTVVTTFFAFYSSDSLVDLNRFAKIVLMLLVTAAVLHSKKHIRLFVWINALSLGFYGLKGGIFTILTGGGHRVWGPPGGFIEGNNELALALIVSIPLMNYLRMTTPYPWVKRFLLLMMAMSAVAAAGTQSRGAFLAMAAMGGFMWWRSPRKLPGLVVTVVAAVALLAFMPQSWHDRMSTIQTYQDDGSAMGRIHAWQTAANVANDRIFGAGYSMYSQSVFNIYSPSGSNSAFDASIARAAHSIYFQVLGEHGYIGLFLFMMIWLTAWGIAGRLRKIGNDPPQAAWLHPLASMLQVSLVGYAVGGAFLSLAYFDLPYNVVLTLVVAQRWRSEYAGAPDSMTPETTQRSSSRLMNWINTA